MIIIDYLAISANNGARGMIFGSLDDGVVGEHNGDGFVVISANYLRCVKHFYNSILFSKIHYYYFSIYLKWGLLTGLEHTHCRYGDALDK